MRRRLPGVILVCIWIAACAAGGTQPAPGQAAAAARVQATVRGLQSWYRPQTGLYRSTGWWNAANAITALADAMRATGTFQDTPVLANTFERAQIAIPPAHQVDHLTGAPGFINRYYDDEGWWALAWIDAYDLTQQARYLAMAQSIFADMAGGWDQTCGGGIWWSKDRTYKNAIANELFFSVAAHLAARARNGVARSGYIRWESQEWRWFRASGLINSDGLINDGLTIRPGAPGSAPVCRNNGRTTWTYNQGVILGALAAATQTLPEPHLLDMGRRIANAALDHLTDAQGVLREPCEPHCTGGDVVQFKGIFVRNLQALQVLDPQLRYAAFFRVNADSIWRTDRIGNRFGLTWSGPPGVPTAGTQASALDALVAAAAGSHL